MLRRLPFALLGLGLAVAALAGAWSHLRRPAYESYVTGDEAAEAAFRMIEERRYAEALPILVRAARKPLLRVHPGDVFQAISDCYFGLDENDRSEPVAHLGFFHAGVAQRLRGNLGQAVMAYTRALAARPDFAEAHDGLGVVAVMQGRFAQAVAHLEHAVTLAPDHPVIRSNLAVAYAGLGRFEAANREVEAAGERGFAEMESLRQQVDRARAELEARR